MKRTNRTHPINVRLLMTLLPLLTGVLALFGVFCNMLYQHKIEEEVTRQLQLQVDSVAYQMDSTLSEINRLSLLVYSDASVYEGLEHAMTDDFVFQDRVDLYLKVMRPLLNHIDSPQKYSVWIFPISDNVFCDHSNIYDMIYFPNADVQDSLLDNGYGKTIFHTDLTAHYYNPDRLYPEDTELLYISRAVTDGDRSPLAIVSAVVYTDYLRSIVESIVPENEPFCYTVSLADGQYLFGDGELLDDMLVVTSRIITGGLQLKIGFTSAIFAQQTSEQTRMLLIFGSFTLLTAAIIIILVCRKIMKPLHGVVRKFRRLHVGDPLIEEPRAGQDEAALIDQTFTGVYRKYYKSVQDQEELEANQKRLEISLLLSRINPHFLYNTLSALRWSMPEEERHIIDRLVAYYRGVLGQGRDVASLSSEVELIEQYLDLQRYTYSKDITFYRDIRDDLLTLTVPKFLLQPVVENAVKYCASDKPITLTLSARMEGESLIICFENNGEPIEDETMHSLNALNDRDQPHLLRIISGPDEPRGYGVFNVIMRIRLLCGAGYGLWHEHPETGGTRAKFVLPAIRDTEFFHNHIKKR